MWIFCKLGFFSAVQHRDKPDTLLVRGRFEGDLERSKVWENTTADYFYRMEMPKHVFTKAVAEIANKIDYGNFKDSVHEGYGSPRDTAYMGCWAELRHGQETQAKVKLHSQGK